MNTYPTPSSITMQRTGETPLSITLEDAVVIMTNQQKTIEELITNNQRMFQFIQEAQRTGSGFNNIQFSQQKLPDPTNRNGLSSSATPAAASTEKPMTLNEYLAMKKAAANAAIPTPIGGGAHTPAPAAAAPAPAAAAPMTLSEFLALKNSGAAAATATTPAAAPAAAPYVPVFDTPSKI
jgi:hypothetical protein